MPGMLVERQPIVKWDLSPRPWQPEAPPVQADSLVDHHAPA